ncbi:protein CTLA-2-alpha-like [Cochliomyia hominivorax]
MSTLTDEEWQEYKQKHNKIYSDEAEERRRREIVCERKKIIEEHNRLYKAGHVAWPGRLNSMSDYTEEERSRMHGFRMT